MAMAAVAPPSCIAFHRSRTMSSSHMTSPMFPAPSFTPWNNSSSNGQGIKSPSPDRPFLRLPRRSPPPGPYKMARSTPGYHHTHPRPPLHTLEFATPTSPSTDRHQPSLSSTPPFPHLLSFDDRTNVLSSTSPAPSTATLSPGVAGGRAPVSSRGRPWRLSMVNRRHPWSTNCGLGPWVFRQQNNSLKILFPGTLH
jgi:hypothetical protein